MLEVDIPGFEKLHLRWLASDYNGTLARDGVLLPGVAPLLVALSDIMEIHVVTADTFGIAKEQCSDLPVKLAILPPGNQAQQKFDYITRLSARSTVCLGNGRNDLAMLTGAALGICVMEEEGACAQTLVAADIACRSARDALNLLLHPRRLAATLRE